MTTCPESAAQAYRRLFLSVEAPPDVVLTRGDGAYCIDDQGRRYLDFGAGLGVNCLGHASPVVLEAIARQARAMIHCGAEFINAPALAYAEELAVTTGFDRFFFSNSGAEANEAALKTARRHFCARGEHDRVEIVALRGAFHGRTLLAISAAGNDMHCRNFGPLVPGMALTDFDDPAALQARVDDRTGAIFVEAVQTRQGVRVLPPAMVDCINTLRRQHGLLVVVDEVQTGAARTGAFLASREMGLEADIVTLGKGLAGGLPIGVTAVRDAVAASMTEGSHGTTFGGGPLVMAVAHAVLAVLRDEAFLARVRRVGEHLDRRLGELCEGRTDLVAPTGRGLLRGVRLAGALAQRATAVHQAALDAGLILRTSGPSALRFTPPLDIGEAHVDQAIELLSAALAGLEPMPARTAPAQ